MLGDKVHLPEQPSMEQVSSPVSAQILEFCESELFPETLIQNSEVGSSSNYCYMDDQSSYTANLDIINYLAPMDNVNAKKVPTIDNNLSVIFDEENNLGFTICPQYLSLPRPGYQFDLSLLQNQIPLIDHISTYPPTDHVGPTTCEDDCLPPSKLIRLNKIPSSFIESYPPLPVETSGIFNGNFFLGNDDMDFKGDIFCPDPFPPPNNSNEHQALSNESQQLLNGYGTPLASEITSLEADSCRVTNKLTTEERKEKIHRYMKKRSERNFSKKIKYACRKTLADSRPRVRGRFAKNDEYGENNRTACSNHEDDTDEDVKPNFQVGVKEEEESFEPSDIFAHQWGEFIQMQFIDPILDLNNSKKRFVV